MINKIFHARTKTLRTNQSEQAHGQPEQQNSLLALSCDPLRNVIPAWRIGMALANLFAAKNKKDFVLNINMENNMSENLKTGRIFCNKPLYSNWIQGEEGIIYKLPIS